MGSQDCKWGLSPPEGEAQEHPIRSKVDLLYTIEWRSAAELDDIEGPLLV